MPVKSSLKKTVLLVFTSANINFEQDTNLGLLYIASSLKKNGHRVVYFDTGTKSFSVDQLKKHLPCLVGFSTDADNYHLVLRLASLLKKHNGKTKIMLGGPHASNHDLDLIKSRNVDIIVRGEGEYTCSEIADYFLNGKGTLSKILGITFKKNNKPTRTRERPPIENLDRLPFPDYNLLPKNKYICTSIITGRGCPHRCAFCSEGRSGGLKYRFRGAQNILDEVRSLLKSYPECYLNINDDTFSVSPKRLLEVCRLFRENFKVGEELIWFCEARVDDLSRHPEILKEMVSAGMVRLQIGIESGCQEILDAYRKGITLDQVRTAVKECVKAKVPSVYGGFIVGGAFESEETIKRTLTFIEELFNLAPGRFECGTSFFAPYSGTEIFRNPEKFGIKILDKEIITAFSLTHCCNETEHLTKDEIIYWKNYCDGKIFSLIKQHLITLPNDLIRSHIALSKKSVLTKWAEVIQRNPYSYWYFSNMESENYKSFKEIDSKELPNWCPTRFPMQVKTEKGKIVLKGTLSPLKFNQFGTMLYELSSGKLTFGEVMKKIGTSYPGHLPAKKTLMKQVEDFYRQVDAEKILLFRQF